ncbi:hypothetical protein ACF07Y_38320 [Streptomyces sp. NPDC016566]|uniref:hypothetical protein n=1 Tax=Streptomyces sp. NPDC016566 TaxID=3364967 RepID=UPI0036FBE22C
MNILSRLLTDSEIVRLARGGASLAAVANAISAFREENFWSNFDMRVHLPEELSNAYARLQESKIAQQAAFVFTSAEEWDRGQDEIKEFDNYPRFESPHWFVEAIRDGDDVILIPFEYSGGWKLSLFSVRRDDDGFTALIPVWTEFPFVTVNVGDDGACEKGIKEGRPDCRPKSGKGCPSQCRQAYYRENGRSIFYCWCPK